MLRRYATKVFAPVRWVPRRGMDEFFPPAGRPKAGRPWTANELRLKSFDDLQALWFVLLKEKNAVLTERLHLKQGGVAQADASRLKKVKLSMARLKTVLGERQREHKAVLSAQQEADGGEVDAYDATKYYARGIRGGEYKKGIRGRKRVSQGMTKREWYRHQRAEGMRRVVPGGGMPAPPPRPEGEAPLP